MTTLDPRKPKTRAVDRFSVKEIKKICSYTDSLSDTRDQLLFEFLYGGLRPREFLELKYKDVDRTLHLDSLHTGSAPLPEKMRNLLEILKTQNQSNMDGYVFTGPNNKQMTPNELSEIFSKWLAFAGVTSRDRTIHNFKLSVEPLRVLLKFKHSAEIIKYYK
ncbi:tyrosine-type recombinase/integrase [Pseudomonas rustica]